MATMTPVSSLGSRVVAWVAAAALGALVYAAVDGAVRLALDASSGANAVLDGWAIGASGQAPALLLLALGHALGRATSGLRRPRLAARAALGLALLGPSTWLGLDLTSGAWISAQPMRYAIHAVLCSGVFVLAALIDGALASEGRRSPWLTTALVVLGATCAAANATLMRGLYTSLHAAWWLVASVCLLLASRRLGASSARKLDAHRVLTLCGASVASAGLLFGAAAVALGHVSPFGPRAFPRSLRGNAEAALLDELDEVTRGGAAPHAAPRSPSARVLPRPSVRSVLLIVVDTLRADTLEEATESAEAALGANVQFLRRLREKSLRFSRAYAHAPITHRSIAAMFHSGQRYRRDFPQSQHLASVLGLEGVWTGAVAWHWFRWQVDGLVAEKVLSLHGFGEEKLYSTSAQDQAIALSRQQLADAKPGPRFQWLHFACMHDPGFDGQVVSKAVPHRLRYARSLAWLDGQLAQLFDSLERSGFLHDAAVILTADHGEGLGDHGMDFHGGSTHEEQLRVPLWISAPGLSPGQDDRVRALVDIPPTVAGLLSAQPHPGWEGMDVFATGPMLDDARIVYLENAGGNEVAVSDGRHKLSYRREQRILAYYDLAKDPKEHNPLGPRQSDASRRLLRALVVRRPELFTRLLGSERARAALTTLAASGRAENQPASELLRALLRPRAMAP